MAKIITPAQRIQNDIAEVQALLGGETEYAAIEQYSSLIFDLDDLLNGDVLNQLEYGYARRWTNNIGEAIEKTKRAIARYEEVRV